MAQDLKSIKITDGALHESPLRGGTIILRGVVDATSLKHLLIDEYQREALPLGKLSKLTLAVKAGEALPDIEIGMRGDKVRSVKDDWFLQDPCYVIDGQQRVNACMNAMAMYPGTPVYLGAAIHFKTDVVWERERFRVLNSDRVKVSPNILLRNMRENHRAIAAVFNMTDESNTSFALGGKVSWDQNMKRGKLITALNVLKISARLHGHVGAGKATRIDELGTQLDNLAEKVTLSQLRDNVRLFFDVIDEVWGIRTVQYRELSPHLNAGFLYMMAGMFSNHLDFWSFNGHKFSVNIDIRRKLSSFPLNDPGISPLTSSVGASQNILYGLMVKHLNSGKRTKRLQPRFIEELPADVESAETVSE